MACAVFAGDERNMGWGAALINLRTHAAEGTWSQTADAHLYLGPREKLTPGGETFDLEGTPYGTELRRRWKILVDKPPAELPKSDGKVRPLFPSH